MKKLYWSFCMWSLYDKNPRLILVVIGESLWIRAIMIIHDTEIVTISIEINNKKKMLSVKFIFKCILCFLKIPMKGGSTNCKTIILALPSDCLTPHLFYISKNSHTGEPDVFRVQVECLTFCLSFPPSWSCVAQCTTVCTHCIVFSLWWVATNIEVVVPTPT